MLSPMIHLPRAVETIDLRGEIKRVHVFGEASAPPVLVLVAPFDVWWTATELCEALAATFRVYLIENITSAESVERNLFSALSDDALDILRQLEPTRRALVVGSSFGGYIATYLAHFHPEHVSGVVMANVWHPNTLQLSAEIQNIMAPRLRYGLDLVADDLAVHSAATDFARIKQFHVFEPYWQKDEARFVADYRQPGFLERFTNIFKANFAVRPTGAAWSADDAATPSTFGRRTDVVVAGAPKQTFVSLLPRDPLTIGQPCLFLFTDTARIPAEVRSYDMLRRHVKKPWITTWPGQGTPGAIRYRATEAAAVIANFWGTHVRDQDHEVAEDLSGEARDIAMLERVYVEKAAAYHCPHLGGADHTLRASHPKAHGVVNATFHVPDDLAPELQVGLFVPGARFDAVLRFSNLGGTPLEVNDDAMADQRGLAVKLLDGGAAVQDFLLNTMPVLASHHARDIVPQPHNADLLSALGGYGVRAENPLTERYFSQTPYRFGATRAVKYSVTVESLPPLSAIPSAEQPDYLRARLAHAVAAGEVVLALEVQFQSDPVREPIEDPRVAWHTPFVRVATLRIPQQTVQAQLADAQGEALRFNPWTCKPAHEPLGAVNRARRRVYATVTQARARANALPEEARLAPARQHIAVIGAGASGMAAALALSEHGHAVTVIESRAHSGGHATSVPLGAHTFDPAFGAFTAAIYPNFVALLGRLGVEYEHLHPFRDALSSFSLDRTHTWHALEDIPHSRHVLEEIGRFDVRAILRDPNYDEVTVADYFAANGFSAEFVHYYFLGGLVYLFAGHPVSYYLNFPIRKLLAYYYSPGMLTGDEPICKVKGGSAHYASTFQRFLEERGVRFLLSTEATVASRSAREVVLRVADREQRFTHLIVTAPPQRALAFLGDAATAHERAALSGFSTTVDTVVLHRDERFMPTRSEDWRYGNVIVANDGEPLSDERPFFVTKMTRSPTDGVTPIFGTYAYRSTLDIAEGKNVSFEHVAVDNTAMRQRRMLRRLQGNANTWFAGAYTTGMTLHEDAIVTGLRAANGIMAGRTAYPILQRPRFEHDEPGLVPWGSEHTLLDVFRFHARVQGDKRAFCFVDGDGKEIEQVTYRELERRSAEIVAALHEAKPGDRVLLIYPPGIEFIVAFLACLRAGVIAVPVFPPNPVKASADLPKLTQVVANSGARIALTTKPYRTACTLGFFRDPKAIFAWPKLEWICTDDAPGKSRASNFHNGAPGDVAFLQYTSGSTSEPKGVMITHANIMHQMQISAASLGFDERTVSVSWVPQYHDLGLISGILLTLYNGAVYVFTSPQDFIKNPSLLGDMMHRYQATTMAAPDFGYRLLARKADPVRRRTWDWSKVEVLMCAGEPVRHETLTEFFAVFAETGVRRKAFCPSYGLAEHTVAGAMWGARTLHVDRQKLETDRVVQRGDQCVVGCGKAPPSVKLRIVDPDTRQVLGATGVGEIWLCSASTAAGYWGMPALSAETFGAQLDTADPDRYLRTGDLGFLHKDEVFVTGRLKDLVIVRGRNVYPQDIERSAESASALLRPGCSIAFSVEQAGSEVVVLVAEAREATVSRDALTPAIHALRKAVLAADGVALHAVVIIKPRRIPKTTSGKVQRSKCKQRYSKDGFASDTLCLDTASAAAAPPVAAVGPLHDRDAIADLLRRAVFDVTRQWPDPERPLLDEVDLDSLRTVELVAIVNDRLDLDLSLSELFACTTLAEMADYISKQVTRAAHPALVPMGKREGQPLFLVHPIQGRVEAFVALGACLSRPLVALQQVQRHESIAQMATAYLTAIRSVQPQGPFVLGGYSFGTLVASEMARQLEREGEPVQALVLLDGPRRGATWDPALMSQVIEREVASVTDPRTAAALGASIGAALNAEALAPAILRAIGTGVASERLTATVQPVLDNARLAQRWERAAPLCPVGDFQAGLAEPGAISVGGDHFSMLQPPHVGELAKRIEAWLDGVTV